MERLNPYKILLVDDDPYIVNHIIDLLLKEKGQYKIYQANNGKVAFKIAQDKLPDLILTDWDMPETNGIQLIRLLKADINTKEIPIIMVTAVMQSSSDLKSALETGANDFIRKPIDETELKARVQSILKISDYQKRIIDNKNREIAENALMLIRNNKFNIKIIKKLKELHESLKDIDENTENLFEFIINSINEKVKQDSWQKFELTVKANNNNFTENLLKKFPTLTNSEIKLCTFLKLGMNTKEIASVLFQSNDSIKVARSRLRKKINLNSEQNLSAYLSSF